MSKKIVKIVDCIKTPLYNLLTKYQKDVGTGDKGAVRDVLTQLRHFCDSNSLSFNEIMKSSGKVYCDEVDFDHEY